MLDETYPIIDFLYNSCRFFAHESWRPVHALSRRDELGAEDGRANQSGTGPAQRPGAAGGDRRFDRDYTRHDDLRTCGRAAWPIKTALLKFRDELEEYVKQTNPTGYHRRSPGDRHAPNLSPLNGPSGGTIHDRQTEISMATITVDGIEIEIRSDERLNAIEAAARAGVEIPHYCWHPGLSVVGSCRMCLVEVGSRDTSGKVSMGPKLVPGCNTQVRDGTVIATQSEKVQHARALVEEGLLLEHPVDCPICDKAGECRLQDYYFKYGQAEGRRADIKPFTSERRDLGDVTFFADRCIMCTRCVRFTREISGTSELMVRDRGAHEEIDIFEGFPLNNKLSGNVVDLCPVGALGDKDFLYKQRVWFMGRHKGVCTGCATGCSIWVEENQDRVHRLKPERIPRSIAGGCAMTVGTAIPTCTIRIGSSACGTAVMVRQRNSISPGSPVGCVRR